MTDQESYNELAYYTLAHRDPSFIHQLVVDAYAAQHADEKSKPIYLAFALAGLYLHNVKRYTGKEVQRAHMQLGKEKKELPEFILPVHRGDVTVADMLCAPPGDERDKAIEQWSASVWEAFDANHNIISAWLIRELGM